MTWNNGALDRFTGMPDSARSLKGQGMSMIDRARRRLSGLLFAGMATAAIAVEGGTIDVWVELSELPPAPAVAASTAASQRDRIALQQERVSEALSRLGAIELARIRSSRNAIAVRIERARIDEVRAIEGVKRVRPARSLHPPQTGGAP